MNTAPKAELVAKIAHRNHISVDEAQRLCDEAWQTLSTNARVTHYLSVFVEKRVERSLRERVTQHDNAAVTPQGSATPAPGKLRPDRAVRLDLIERPRLGPQAPMGLVRP
ncbi:hypothetical protein PTE30175_00460 [Pandoraea terrae]|uniref:DUF3562 domain-containing protein n=2 Tax=Pandoraea terrae TaxID=1537710 RepID=A0A5E4S093_9BURK|nr:hypothetical protein PTE30175_00460 [Pandoraea terrae]